MLGHYLPSNCCLILILLLYPFVFYLILIMFPMHARKVSKGSERSQKGGFMLGNDEDSGFALIMEAGVVA